MKTFFMNLLAVSIIASFPADLEKIKGTGLANESVDYVIVKDLIHQAKEKENIFKEAYRILKPKGKILVIEWSEKDRSIGPAIDMRMNYESLLGIIEDQKFLFLKKYKFGNFHYGILASK